MLNICEIKPSDLAVSVEIDSYVPIVVHTFSTPIGAVYYRVGNFETSLVEIAIDPRSGTIRSIDVISIDRAGVALDDNALPQVQGLPTVTQESMPQQRQDDHREVTVGLAEDRLIIDWSNGQQLDTKTVHGRLSFFIGRGVLLGAAIKFSTKAEQQSFIAHMPKGVPATDFTSS